MFPFDYLNFYAVYFIIKILGVVAYAISILLLLGLLLVIIRNNFLSYLIQFFALLIVNNYAIKVLLLGTLTHSLIDQFDDIYVKRDLDNWFWFTKRKNKKFVYSITISIIMLLYAYLNTLGLY